MMSRPFSIGVAGVLLTIACVVLLLQVDVTGNERRALACGSPFDIVAGRLDWRDWWASDVGDATSSSEPSFARSTQCAGMVNRRLLLAAGLAVIAVVEVSVFETIRVRHAAPQPSRGGRADRFRRLGTAAAVVGIGVTAAGLAALVRLWANPKSTLFLYVDRWVAVVVGLLMLLPAVVLIFAGRVLSLAATSSRARDEDTA